MHKNKNYHAGNFPQIHLFDTVKANLASKNDVLQSENKPVKYVFFILEGIVREHLIFNDGRDINITFWSAPALIGSIFNCEPGTNANTSLSMLTSGKYRKIPIELFLKQIGKDQRGIHCVNDILETQNHWLRKRSLLLSHKNAEDRVKDFALTFPGLYKVIPDYHIASYLGITPVTMHRAKTKLSNNNNFAQTLSK
ncbi:MAG: Crp/Fnr family transcriptional regulator [Cellvibrionaceae bacterium]